MFRQHDVQPLSLDSDLESSQGQVTLNPNRTSQRLKVTSTFFFSPELQLPEDISNVKEGEETSVTVPEVEVSPAGVNTTHKQSRCQHLGGDVDIIAGVSCVVLTLEQSAKLVGFSILYSDLPCPDPTNS